MCGMLKRDLSNVKGINLASTAIDIQRTVRESGACFFANGLDTYYD